MDTLETNRLTADYRKLVKANKQKRRQYLADYIETKKFDMDNHHRCIVGFGLELACLENEGNELMHVPKGSFKAIRNISRFAEFYGYSFEDAERIYEGEFWELDGFDTTKEQAAKFLRS